MQACFGRRGLLGSCLEQSGSQRWTLPQGGVGDTSVPAEVETRSKLCRAAVEQVTGCKQTGADPSEAAAPLILRLQGERENKKAQQLLESGICPLPWRQLFPAGGGGRAQTGTSRAVWVGAAPNICRRDLLIR